MAIGDGAVYTTAAAGIIFGIIFLGGSLCQDVPLSHQNVLSNITRIDVTESDLNHISADIYTEDNIYHSQSSDVIAKLKPNSTQCIVVEKYLTSRPKIVELC